MLFCLRASPELLAISARSTEIGTKICVSETCCAAASTRRSTRGAPSTRKAIVSARKLLRCRGPLPNTRILINYGLRRARAHTFRNFSEDCHPKLTHRASDVQIVDPRRVAVGKKRARLRVLMALNQGQGAHVYLFAFFCVESVCACTTTVYSRGTGAHLPILSDGVMACQRKHLGTLKCVPAACEILIL